MTSLTLQGTIRVKVVWDLEPSQCSVCSCFPQASQCGHRITDGRGNSRKHTNKHFLFNHLSLHHLTRRGLEPSQNQFTGLNNKWSGKKTLYECASQTTSKPFKISFEAKVPRDPVAGSPGPILAPVYVQRLSEFFQLSPRPVTLFRLVIRSF